jgi:DNA-binding NtrC family response regulator
MKPRILIIDDEVEIAKLTARVLQDAGYECETCASATAALQIFEQREADVVITDLKMPRMDGFELMRELRKRRSRLPVILLTGFASISSAVKAMREGAFDYVAKPFDEDELCAVVARALEMSRLERENRHLRQNSFAGPEIDAVIAESPNSRQVMELIRRVAPHRATVLIQGESGTGKELVARLLHYWSERVDRQLVAVNCKAFADGVLESELFGHEKGAFTGAMGARAGCFERADGGTLFLDEIGEIGTAFQGKLLRVLQEGEILRVGSDRPRKVDVRIVAATNRELRKEVAAGRFREDLYFRLNVIQLRILPLRERRGDILPLARHFFSTHAAESGRELKLSATAAEALLAHGWRGNVRELENVIQRAAVLCENDTIEASNLGLEKPFEESSEIELTQELSLQQCLDHAAAVRIRTALESAKGNRLKAASILKVQRTTLWRLMKRLGFETEGQPDQDLGERDRDKDLGFPAHSPAH